MSLGIYRAETLRKSGRVLFVKEFMKSTYPEKKAQQQPRPDYQGSEEASIVSQQEYERSGRRGAEEAAKRRGSSASDAGGQRDSAPAKVLGKRSGRQEEVRLPPLYQHMGVSRHMVSQVSTLAPNLEFDLGDPTALIKQETGDASERQAPADDADLNYEFGDYVDNDERRAREERALIDEVQLKKAHLHLLTCCPK